MKSALDTAPAIFDDAVQAMVERDTGVLLGAGRRPRLVVLPLGAGAFALTYQVRVTTATESTVLFIDAHDGRIHDSYEAQAHSPVTERSGVREYRAVALDAMPVGGAFYAVDATRAPGVRTLDMRGDLARTLAVLNDLHGVTWADVASAPANAWDDAAVVGAHLNAGIAYDVLLRHFGRAGLAPDVPIVNLVHPVAPADLTRPPGATLFRDQVFYAGDGVVVYGEGTLTEPREAATLHLVAHALAHGVLERSSRLRPRGEAGALAEAFCDILATAVTVESGSLSVRVPAAQGRADHYDRRVTDPRAIYANAGIAMLAFALAVEGGAHPTTGVRVEGVGVARREQIERVFYSAFIFLLPADATFAMAREATLQAAGDLYGHDGDERSAVAEAWAAVGVR